VSGEKQNLAPIDSNLQVVSRKNVTKIHKNIFKTGSDAENLPKWLHPGLAGCLQTAN
jgi:hypothetical protein